MGCLKHWKIVIEYDGGRYCGWQAQSNGCSIQGEIARALETILKEPVKVGGAGRTDAGVHALGQVADFNTIVDVDPGRLRWQLNALLPDDIIIREIEEVSENFDARRSAIARTYSYFILNRSAPSPFWGRYSWWVSRPLDIAGMRDAAERLVGIHDFSALTVAKVGPMVRDVKAIEIEPNAETDDLVRVTIAANAFLHHMVRLIVGTLVEVGVGKLPAAAVDEILASKDVRRAGPRAPAKGLRLDRVDY
ncbi:MAG: tRNA pseudouridine(38-40) synthase TruA [Actinomycetota bacterium]|nr:tRNA pseudouridine(38-40) synthase TruA [Actinomycetota bacterium]